MIVLYYIYSKYFQFFSFFDEGEANFTAMMAVCLWMLMIIMNIIALLMNFQLLDTGALYQKTITGIVIAIALMVMNYFLFVNKKRYSIIVDRFSNESDVAWILGAISVAFVTVLPFYFVFYYAVPYLTNING